MGHRSIPGIFPLSGARDLRDMTIILLWMGLDRLLIPAGTGTALFYNGDGRLFGANSPRHPLTCDLYQLRVENSLL